MPYGFGLTACAKCQEQILAPRQHRNGLRDPGWQVIDALGEKQGSVPAQLGYEPRLGLNQSAAHHAIRSAPACMQSGLHHDQGRARSAILYAWYGASAERHCNMPRN
jgi:hypothetical protein